MTHNRHCCCCAVFATVATAVTLDAKPITSLTGSLTYHQPKWLTKVAAAPCDPATASGYK